MLKGSFERKLNSEVDKDNINSFRSFKKELNRTLNGHVDSVSKPKETKIDNSVDQTINSRGKTSIKEYNDSKEKDMDRIDTGTEVVADIGYERDDDSDEESEIVLKKENIGSRTDENIAINNENVHETEENNYDAVAVCDDQEVYYEEEEQLETEKELAEDTITDLSIDGFDFYEDEYSAESVGEDNNNQNFYKDIDFIQNGMASGSKENVIAISENVSGYPVIENDKPRV